MKTEKLVSLFGKTSKLATFLGITPHAIYQWPEYVPRQWGYEIEARSAGLIKYEPAPNSAVDKIAQMNISTFVDLDKL